MNAAATGLNVRESADRIFDALLPVWNDGLDKSPFGWLHTDFWKAGNTLDSAINYFVVTGRTDAATSAATLVEKSYALYKSRPWGTGPWRDDYGWWGNAFLNAVNHAKQLGLSSELTINCLRAAQECWSILSDSAEENRTYGENLPLVQQIVGARYTPWNQDSAAKYFADPRSRYTFGAVPNTVTSANYLSLSLALLELDVKSVAYSTAVNRSVNEWMHLLGLTYRPERRDQNPCNMLFNDFLLVRETPNPWEHLNWCFDLARAWSADQGLCLYILSRLPHVIADAKTTKYAREILEILLQGYDVYFTSNDESHSRSVNGLILDDTFREFETRTIPEYKDSNLSNFNNNYVTGPGVFMRYLAYAFPTLSDDLKATFRRVIEQSMARAWENRDPETNQIRYWYGTLEESPYYQYFLRDDGNNDLKPGYQLWKLAPQVAALDLFVAGLRTAQK